MVKDFPKLADLNLARFTDGNFGLHGAMDEARIQRGTSSDNWVWASYMTVAANGTFESYSAVAGTAAGISIQLINGKPVLSWGQGTLESAPDITGPYSPVNNAPSPYTVPITGPRQFFRVKLR